MSQEMKSIYPKDRVRLCMIGLWAVSLVISLLVSVFFKDRVGSYQKLLTIAVAALLTVVLFLLNRKVKRMHFPLMLMQKQNSLRNNLAPVLFLSATLLVSIPLRLFGDAIHETAGFSYSSPFPADDVSSYPMLFVFWILLPAILSECVLHKIQLEFLFPRLGTLLSALLYGALWATLQMNLFRIPGDWLLASLLSLLMLFTGSVLWSFCGMFLYQFVFFLLDLFAYVSGATTAIPSIAQCIAMFLVFLGFALPLFYGSLRQMNRLSKVIPKLWILLMVFVCVVSGLAISAVS